MATHMSASRACRTCYQRKIKCDKALPKCSACTQFKRLCAYREAWSSPLTTNGEIFDTPRSSSNDSRVSSEQLAALVGPFLDHEISQWSKAASHDSKASLECLAAFMRGPCGEETAIRHHLSLYFERISPWLPVISDEKLYVGLLNPLITASPDITFLYACIVLHTVPLPEDQDLRTWDVYFKVRRCLSEVESQGKLSTEILQGCILIALFELGHAIYPAALASVGMCSKYAAALGLDFEIRGQALKTESFDCLRSEEKKRVWWAILILDRFANLGNPRLMLTLPDPPPEALLPLPMADDASSKGWGRYPDQVIATLSSPSEDLGRFGCVCQTAYLLSCVYRHIADDEADVSFHETERQQLDSTLHAQVNYHARNIGPVNSILCYQTAFSFSALRILYPTSGRTCQHEMAHESQAKRAQEIAVESAEVALQTAKWYLEGGLQDFAHGDVPIFTLPWLYSTGVWLVEQHREEDLWLIQQTFKELQKKWRLAGVFSALLRARKAMARQSGVGTDDNPLQRTCNGLETGIRPSRRTFGRG